MFIKEEGKVYPKETSSKVIIRFQDCDPLRHLNNAKYFDYFYNAREDQVPKLYGVELKDFYIRYDSAWVVYNHQIAYIRPALMGEWVSIHSRLIWFNHNTILVEYYMTDEKRNELKTLLWSTLRYVNVKSGKSSTHEGAVKDYLEASLLAPVSWDALDFQERIRSIKQEIIESK